MANYGKLGVVLIVSESSDYADIQNDFSAIGTDTWTPTGYGGLQKISASTSGVTVDLQADDERYLVVRNLDSSIEVTIQVDFLGGGSNVDIDLSAGEIAVLPNVDFSGNITLTSASGTPDLWVGFA